MQEHIRNYKTIYDNVRKHEEIFKTYDKDYRYENIQQIPSQTNLNNIYALFPVLKKHDDELIKLTKDGNKYTKSDTLDDLLDGTLTQTYINDLENLRDYSPAPIMPNKVVDADEMMQIAAGYRQQAQATSNEDLRKSLNGKKKLLRKKWKVNQQIMQMYQLTINQL